MKFVADLHIHSKYSRATSRDMDIDHLNKWAKIKGIKILGTGDFTHHLWLKELKEKLEPAEPGLFKLQKKIQTASKKNDWLPDNAMGSDGQDRATRFLLSSEVSCIYSKNNRVRKVHVIILAPSFKVVEKINTRLGWIGNIKSDGRPVLGLDVKELLKIVLTISDDCLIIPGHIWTPWFSLFGANSGFDSIEECFEEYSNYIYAVETGLSCYDSKTEILTNDGWKKFSAVKYSDKICTLNPKNNEIKFQKPIKIHSYNYKGKMYHLKTKRVDLLVTPNHNLFYSHCDFRKKPEFSLKKAEFLFNKSKRLKKDGLWTGKDIEYFVLPAVKIRHGSKYYSGFRNKQGKKLSIKPWLKFFGFWIAEGWTTQGKNGDYNVCLCNYDKKIIAEMKSILNDFGYNPLWFERTHTLRIRDYQLFSYLKQFGKCYDKFIPLDIKSLAKEYLEILLKYYIKGDGHIYGRNRKGLSATTTSIRLRDDLQEIALKVGFSAYYKLHQKKGTPFSSPYYNYKRVYKQRNDSWLIFFIRKNIHMVLPSIIKKRGYIESWVNFNGPVFCVTVPNRVVYVRRNGIPVWCGNSDPEMNWPWSALDKITLISNSDSHSPFRIGREANVFDTDLSYQGIADVIKSGSPSKFLETIEFFSEEYKYHIGILNRINNLADRKKGDQPDQAIPFRRMIPLDEIIADAKGLGPSTKAVRKEYKGLVKHFGTEFEILLNANLGQIERISSPEISEGISRVRRGKIDINPGHDGEYGQIKIFKDKERGSFSKQASLF